MVTDRMSDVGAFFHRNCRTRSGRGPCVVDARQPTDRPVTAVDLTGSTLILSDPHIGPGLAAPSRRPPISMRSDAISGR